MKHDPISTGMWDLSRMVACPYCDAAVDERCQRLTSGTHKRHSHEGRVEALVQTYRELQRSAGSRSTAT